MSPCKLIVHGAGPNVWGECACEIPGRGRMWAWLGTYEMDQGRRAKLRVAHERHRADVARGVYRGFEEPAA